MASNQSFQHESFKIKPHVAPSHVLFENCMFEILMRTVNLEGHSGSILPQFAQWLALHGCLIMPAICWDLVHWSLQTSKHENVFWAKMFHSWFHDQCSTLIGRRPESAPSFVPMWTVVAQEVNLIPCISGKVVLPKLHSFLKRIFTTSIQVLFLFQILLVSPGFLHHVEYQAVYWAAHHQEATGACSIGV